MKVTVTVHGRHTAFLRPERAVVHARIALEGPSAEQAYAGAAEASTQLSGTVTALHDPTAGPVTWWSSDQVRTWSHRPWNQDGVQLPLVHHAQVGYQVKFSDFEVLGRWLGQVTSVVGFTLDTVEWALTAARREELVRQVRAEAVRDARAKAQAYANALELGPVQVVALADAGMLGEGLHPTGGTEGDFMRVVQAGGGPEISFAPQDIEVSATVDARFTVG